MNEISHIPNLSRLEHFILRRAYDYIENPAHHAIKSQSGRTIINFLRNSTAISIKRYFRTTKNHE